jgi:predicted RNA binding protein with dsRBD fold (UPF0201 family)
MVLVTLATRYYPTEDKARVLGAVTQLFPDAEIVGDETLTATSTSVELFGELLKRQRIRDAARRIMRRGIKGNRTSFRLNKQVAAIGKISFSEENRALGDIEVTIESEDIEALIDTIAPSTRMEGR